MGADRSRTPGPRGRILVLTRRGRNDTRPTCGLGLSRRSSPVLCRLVTQRFRFAELDRRMWYATEGALDLFLKGGRLAGRKPASHLCYGP